MDEMLIVLLFSYQFLYNQVFDPLQMLSTVYIMFLTGRPWNARRDWSNGKCLIVFTATNIQ